MVKDPFFSHTLQSHLNLSDSKDEKLRDDIFDDLAEENAAPKNSHALSSNPS